jgi:bifunctional non-homologous end joining protein LigD
MIELLLPMLAAPGEPFDSDEHLFEVKWDGIRALAAISPAGWRLWGRDRADYTLRYPELGTLRRLPADTILDGELVWLLPSGLPDLEALHARHQTTTPAWIRYTSRSQPVSYVVFDLLRERGRSLLGEPLRVRRERLQVLLGGLQEPRVLFAQGVVGSGQAFFQAVVQQGHEGVMAKHRASRYLPGRRSAAWQKIKPRLILPCVIVGFVPGRGGRLRWLLVATVCGGRLRYAATVRCRMTESLHACLQEQLARRLRPRPVVPCPRRAVWVEPELYGQVRALGWTGNGRLRGAHFLGLLDPPSGHGGV